MAEGAIVAFELAPAEWTGEMSMFVDPDAVVAEAAAAAALATDACSDDLVLLLESLKSIAVRSCSACSVAIAAAVAVGADGRAVEAEAADAESEAAVAECDNDNRARAESMAPWSRPRSDRPSAMSIMAVATSPE